MGIAIGLTQTGGPDVLKAESITEARPGPGEVWIEQEAIGVNYLDVTQRNGAVPIPLPSGLGLEAAGRVAAIGADVANVAVGERVAYILGPIGSYASGRLYPAQRLVRLTVYDGIGELTFAASLDCLRPRGLMVSFGASSGAPEPVAVATLNAKGSLFLTRPGLAAHAALESGRSDGAILLKP